MASKKASRVADVERAPGERVSSVSTKKPNKDFESIKQAGLDAHALALRDRARLEERLGPGTIPGLQHALETLGAAVPQAKQARTAAAASTQTQRAAIDHGYALVTAVHTSVVRRHRPVAVQREFGVGSRIDPRSPKGVEAAIGQILDHAAEHPADARAAGILPRDLDALRAARGEIQTAAGNKDAKHTSAPQSTKARNAAANQVLLDVDEIASAGVLEFAHDDVQRAKYEALLGFGARKKKAKGNGGGGSGTGTTG